MNYAPRIARPSREDWRGHAGLSIPRLTPTRLATGYIPRALVQHGNAITLTPARVGIKAVEQLALRERIRWREHLWRPVEAKGYFEGQSASPRSERLRKAEGKD